MSWIFQFFQPNLTWFISYAQRICPKPLGDKTEKAAHATHSTMDKYKWRFCDLCPPAVFAQVPTIAFLVASIPLVCFLLISGVCTNSRPHSISFIVGIFIPRRPLALSRAPSITITSHTYRYYTLQGWMCIWGPIHSPHRPRLSLWPARLTRAIHSARPSLHSNGFSAAAKLAIW